MDDCIINLQLPNHRKIELGSVDKNALELNFYEGFLQMLNSESVNLNNIRTQLINIVSSGDIISVKEYSEKEYGDFIPNYTESELRDKFPDIPFGTNVPKILLVNSNQGFTTTDDITYKKVIIGSNEVYVVPEQNIKSFSNYLILKEQLSKLYEDYKRGNIDKIVEEIYKETLEQNIENNTKESIRERFELIEQQVKQDVENFYKNKVTEYQQKQLDKHLRNKRAEFEKIVNSTNLEELENKINERQRIYDEYRIKLGYSATDKQYQELNEKKRKLDDAEFNYTQSKNKLENAILQLEKLDDGSYVDSYTQSLSERVRYGFSESIFIKKITNLEERKNALELELHNPEIINSQTKQLELITELEGINAKLIELHEKLKNAQDNHSIKIYTTKDREEKLTANALSALEYFLDNQKDCLTILSQETYSLLYDTCRNIIENHLIFNTSNEIVDLISRKIKRNNKGEHWFEYNDLVDLFHDKGILPKDSPNYESKFSNKLNQLFFNSQSGYSRKKGVSVKDGNIYLNKYKNNLMYQLNLTSPEQLIGTLPLLDEDGSPRIRHGMFFYKISTDKGQTYKYYWSDSKNSEFTEAVLFDSEKEAIEHLNLEFPKLRLLQNSTKFTRDYKSASEMIISPKSKIYHKGDIILALDYEYGKIEPPYYADVNWFYGWLEDHFKPNDVKYLKECLTSIDHMVAFYSRFGNRMSYRSTVGIQAINSELEFEYDNTIREVLQEAQKISESDLIEYQVLETTKSIQYHKGKRTYFGDPREYETKIIRKGKPGFKYGDENVTENVVRKNTTRIYWESIKAVFENNGIKMELLSNAEMNEKFNIPSDKVARAFVEGGIIFINIDKATESTVVHEYAHVLLRLLYDPSNPNDTRYMDLLKKYKEAKKDFKQVYAKYYERYRETYHLPEYDENVEPSLKVIEEMFADDYSNHLTSFSQTNVLENLFRQIDEEVSGQSIFDGMTGPDLVNFSNNSIHDLFTEFSNQVRIARNKIGMSSGISNGLPISMSRLNYIIKNIEQDRVIQLSQSDNLETSSEIGILEKC